MINLHGRGIFSFALNHVDSCFTFKFSFYVETSVIKKIGWMIFKLAEATRRHPEM